MNPFLTLGVGQSAGDNEIRQAYLQAIKTASPDRDPDRFREISGAYELIKTEESRASYLVLASHTQAETPTELLRDYCNFSRSRPVPRTALTAWLKSCLKN